MGSIRRTANLLGSISRTQLARPAAIASIPAAIFHRRFMSSPIAPSSPSAAPATAGAPVAAAPIKQQLERFPISIPNPDAPIVRTAACLIIGDEVLNGKTKDSNSNFLAKAFFDLAIDLKRIEVIADDEDEIIEAVRRLAAAYDIVITSGGIGPTHDDITYDSIAKAFSNGELVYDQETIKRMSGMNTRFRAEQTEEQKTARLRMALFPAGAEILFVQEELWVPVVKVAGKVHILPGVPSLFERLLTGLSARFIPLPPTSEKPFRVLVHTALPESSIAPFLTKLSERVKSEEIRIGSYPKLGAGVDVSLIGRDQARLKELSEEVIAELMGSLVLEGKLGEEKENTGPAKM